MLEKEIEKKCCDHARKLGFLVYKFVSPTQRGVPDRMFIAFGRTLFIEFKAPGKKPTKLQRHHMDKLTAAGMDCIVIDSLETGRQFLENTYENYRGHDAPTKRSPFPPPE